MGDKLNLDTVRRLDAEQSVLGGLMLQGDALDRITFLRREHFWSDDHRLIWDSLLRLVEAGKQPDLLLVHEDLMARGHIHVTLNYLGVLIQATPSVHNIKHYADMVRDRYLRRQLSALAIEMGEAAHNPAIDQITAVEQAETMIMGIMEPNQDGEPALLIEMVDVALERRERRERGGIEIIDSGYASLDKLVSLEAAMLMVIAGRPSMGKSALAQGIAEHVARSRPVYYWSGEMGAAQLGGRALAHHEGRIGLPNSLQHIAALDLRIDLEVPMSLSKLKSKLRRQKRKYGLGAVVLDYLQLMSGDAKTNNRNEEIGSISRGLKGIAKEFSVPVIVVSSLNRGPETRPDKRPMLSDLRESGDIESDADVICMIYRDHYYNEFSAMLDVSEVIIRKNRDGATGTAYLDWVKDEARFTDYFGQHFWNDARPTERPKRGEQKSLVERMEAGSKGAPAGG